MKKKSKKAEVYEQILLLERFRTFVVGDFKMKCDGEDDSTDIEKLIANGEFDKALKRYTLEQLERELHYAIDTFLCPWYVERLPEMKPIAEAIEKNDRNYYALIETINQGCNDSLSAILNNSGVWDNSTIKVTCDKNVLRVSPSAENNDSIKMSFHKWDTNPNSKEYEANISVDCVSFTINPNTQTNPKSRHNKFKAECLELANFLYHHKDVLDEMYACVAKHQDSRDKAENDRNVEEAKCYADALAMLNKKAFDLYYYRRYDHVSPFRPDLWSAENIGEKLTECCGHCGKQNTIKHSIIKQGFKHKCPKCGEDEHFCSLCMDAEDNPSHYCDWINGECWRDRQWNEYRKTLKPSK